MSLLVFSSFPILVTLKPVKWLVPCCHCMRQSWEGNCGDLHTQQVQSESGWWQPYVDRKILGALGPSGNDEQAPFVPGKLFLGGEHDMFHSHSLWSFSVSLMCCWPMKLSSLNGCILFWSWAYFPGMHFVFCWGVAGQERKSKDPGLLLIVLFQENGISENTA